MKTRIQTTYPAEAANYATRHPLAKPLYGFVIVDGHTCAVEQCSANDDVQFEVLSPDGYIFDEGTHIFCCYNIKDLKERCDGAHVDPCGDDCDCMIDAVKKCNEMRDALATKTDYKVGDRVRVLSISGIDQARFLESSASTWLYEVTVVCADQEDGESFGHDLLVVCKQHDSVYWVDFNNVQPA